MSYGVQPLIKEPPSLLCEDCGRKPIGRRVRCGLCKKLVCGACVYSKERGRDGLYCCVACEGDVSMEVRAISHARRILKRIAS